MLVQQRSEHLHLGVGTPPSRKNGNDRRGSPRLGRIAKACRTSHPWLNGNDVAEGMCGEVAAGTGDPIPFDNRGSKKSILPKLNARGSTRCPPVPEGPYRSEAHHEQLVRFR